LLTLNCRNEEVKWSRAQENLNKEIEILKECSANDWVNRYEKELAELS
jgi:hypothetical protein